MKKRGPGPKAPFSRPRPRGLSYYGPALPNVWSKSSKPRRPATDGPTKASLGLLGEDEGGWVYERFTLPRVEARERVRAFGRQWPPEAYMSSIFEWEELPDDMIRVVLRRLPSAD